MRFYIVANVYNRIGWYPYHVLLSYELHKSMMADYAEKWEEGVVKSIIVDSGAVTYLRGKSFRDLYKLVEEYAKFLKYWTSRGIEFEYVELDADTVLPLKKIESIRRHLHLEVGKPPIIVWHQTRGVDYFDKMLEETHYVGIPAFSTPMDRRVWKVGGKKVDMLSVYKTFVDKAKAAGKKIHYFGAKPKKEVFWLAPHSFDVSIQRYFRGMMSLLNMEFATIGKPVKTFHLESVKINEKRLEALNAIREYQIALEEFEPVF